MKLFKLHLIFSTFSILDMIKDYLKRNIILVILQIEKDFLGISGVLSVE